ncbi:MAG: DUF5703 domain-containing protein [Tepidisphaeraceae bacterium]
MRFHHRNQGRSAFDLCVEQQGLAGVKDQLWNPLANLTFGGLVRGDGLISAGVVDGQYASTPFRAWRLRSAQPATSHDVRAVLHVAQTSTLDDWLSQVDQIDCETVRESSLARQATRLWWSLFWQRSHIAVNTCANDPTNPAWQVGRNYQLFRYQLGCNAHGKWPTKFNGGLFTYDPEFVDPTKKLDPDFRQWGGGSFTAQNQRLVYWPMLKSGDIDLMKPQFDFYLRMRGNAELRSKVYWNIDGACFTEQIENFGLPVSFEYGWKRLPDMPHGVEHNAWVSHQWDTVFEFCLMMLEAHRYANADLSEYVPFIESCLGFYDAFYPERDDQGKRIIEPGTALETYKNALNPTSTIAALNAVLTALLGNCESQMDLSLQRDRWSRLLASLPDFAYREMRGHRVISPAWRWSHKQNCEFPQLYPVYPYGQFGVGRPELQVAIDTWHFGFDAPDQKQIMSWHQDAIFCARLGLTDEAAKLTIEKMKDAPRRFPTFWGPGHDWVPDHNWGGSGMIGLQEMLLQCVDDQLYVLPAWPRQWDVSFKLHAPRGTTVECVFRAGRLESLVVTPNERATDVVLPT